MRILSWNCRRATEAHPLWDVLEELSPDVALLQEVGSIPDSRFAHYNVRSAVPRTKSGNRQRFSTTLLSRWPISIPVQLETPQAWVNAQLAEFSGNILAFEVLPVADHPLVVLNVYSPAWPLNRNVYVGQQVTGIQLEQNPEIWVADLVTAALRHMELGDRGACIVGGDFNSCVTFDSWPGGPRGNQEWLDRMAMLGFVECLHHHQGRLTPTFRRPGRSNPHCQIDKIFASRSLAAHLLDCHAESAERIYGLGLSDHLPVMAEFQIPVVAA